MKALYRKYRPTKITDVIGQEQVTKPLGSALKSGNFSHSYLFTGPRGCGKTSVARIFAHEVNQFPYTIEDSYTDIIEIDAASSTKFTCFPSQPLTHSLRPLRSRHDTSFSLWLPLMPIKCL